MTSLGLENSSLQIQQLIDDLDGDDQNRANQFIDKIGDYRNLVAREKIAEADRYYDLLMNELKQLRQHYCVTANHAAIGASAGAVIGGWFLGTGVLLGGAIGGALGYFGAKAKKEEMFQLCDALLVEVGHRPTG